MSPAPDWIDFEEKLRCLQLALAALVRVIEPVTCEREFLDVPRNELAALVRQPAREAEGLYTDFLALRAG